jgi:uncharacterized protein (TIGR03435 family)
MTRVPRFVVAILLVMSVALAHAQTDGQQPRFQVASVKANPSQEAAMRLDIQPGGRFVTVNIPLPQLIRFAYSLQLYQIAGAPSWVGGARFDITAVADRDIVPTAAWSPGRFATVQLMTQSLLADRFRLVAHHETRPSQAYSLVIDKSARGAGDKLTPAKAECGTACGMHLGPGTLAARKVPLPQLAELLSQVTGRLVTDDTGLSGAFDFDLRWSHDLQQPADDAPSIFTAVQEQLGLKLATVTGPVDYLVIDRIERPDPD